MAQEKVYKDHRYAIKRLDQSFYSTYTALLDETEPKGRAKKFCEILDPPGKREPPPDGYESGEVYLGDLPWPTLVLGSGCAAIENSNYLSLRDLLAGVNEHLSKLPEFLEDGVVVGSEEIVRFVENLYTDRIGPTAAQTGVPAASPAASPATQKVEISDTAVLLVVLAARLTRLYHLIQADRLSPESRWDDAVATYSTSNEHSQLLTTDDFDPIKQDLSRLSDLIAPDPGDPVTVLVADLLDRIDRGFKRTVTLRRDDLRLVTEVAWYHLTLSTAVYPGWTELLLSMLFQLSGGGPLSRRRPPIKFLPTAASTVAALLQRPTQNSWEQRWNSRGASTVREQFFDEAAYLLKAQADLIDSSRNSDARGARYPPAAAFVSGFDIELEMSLWKRNIPFTVMVPVHVHQDDHTGAFAWLAYDVEPFQARTAEEELDALTKGGSWRVGRTALKVEHSLRPIVVRMSGCPLFEIPRPGDTRYATLKSELGYRPKTKLSIIHAVVVDEYTSMQISLADIAGTIPQMDSKEVVVQSLPRELTNDPHRNPRYWLCFGVQVSDSAIRFRLFVQLSTLRLEERPFELDPELEAESDPSSTSERRATSRSQLYAGDAMFEAPSAGSDDRQSTVAERTARAGAYRAPRGLAVNTRIDHDEAILLYWLGFDIVRDDSKNLISALEHCRLHMISPEHRPDLTNGCELTEDGT